MAGVPGLKPPVLLQRLYHTGTRDSAPFPGGLTQTARPGMPGRPPPGAVQAPGSWVPDQRSSRTPRSTPSGGLGNQGS